MSIRSSVRHHRKPHLTVPSPTRNDERQAREIESIRKALSSGMQVERLSRTFRALGDPTRSRLVLALSMREMCVSDLARVVGTSLSAISHQLRILRDLEIVRVRRDGRSQLYTLNEQAFGFCAPRLCHAWKQTLGPAGHIEPSDGGPGPSRPARRRRT